MATQALAKLGAVCGIVFPLGLFLTGGTYALRGFALAAIVLFVPFLAHLCSLVRQAEGEGGWLAPTAFAAGLAGITLKLASVAPEIADRRYHFADGSQLHKALQATADAGTAVCLLPFAIMCAAIAIAALRTGLLPRSLAYGAAVTGLALAANGTYELYRFSGSVPALLLFLLWTLAAGIVLLRRTLRSPARAAQANPLTAA